jgi:hypothetical protein
VAAETIDLPAIGTASSFQPEKVRIDDISEAINSIRVVKEQIAESHEALLSSEQAS